MKATAQVIEIGHNVETYREAAAKRIRTLMEDWTANTLGLGAELATARETFPINPKRPEERMGFSKWAQEKTGLQRGQINNLLRINKKFGGSRESPRMGVQVMKLLASEHVPASARQEVIDRTEKGEQISRKEARKIVEAHTLPSPKAANTQAKEEGHPVLASDGYIYFGTDPSKAKEGEDRRSMVFGVRRALEHLGNIHLTGRQFLDYAFPHQLWTVEEAPIIKKALKWLVDLDDAWGSRK